MATSKSTLCVNSPRPYDAEVLKSGEERRPFRVTRPIAAVHVAGHVVIAKFVVGSQPNATSA